MHRVLFAASLKRIMVHSLIPSNSCQDVDRPDRPSCLPEPDDFIGPSPDSMPTSRRDVAMAELTFSPFQTVTSRLEVGIESGDGPMKSSGSGKALIDSVAVRPDMAECDDGATVDIISVK
jgi:hypothetical protein